METSKKNMTQVCLVFDDGFKKSCKRIAQLFEERNINATFAVLVNHEGFMPKFPKGNFELWNELQDRGHIIHPHGYDHEDLTTIPFSDAKIKIDKCLEYFERNLRGFDAKNSIYHFAYNRSTPAINSYLLKKVKAIRATGFKGEIGTGMNMSEDIENRIFNCSWHGPDYCDDHLLNTLKIAEKEQPILFMYMLHGLDEEGWGPIRETGLVNALNYIIKSKKLKIAEHDFI